MRGFVIIFWDWTRLKLVQYLHLNIWSDPFQLVLTRTIKMDFSGYIPERFGGLRSLNEYRSKVGNIQYQLTSMFLVSANLYWIVVDLKFQGLRMLSQLILNVNWRLMHLDIFHVLGTLLVLWFCHIPEAKGPYCRLSKRNCVPKSTLFVKIQKRFTNHF